MGGNYSASGVEGNLLTIPATGTWYLNATGAATADYVDVTYSDASGGTQVSATSSVGETQNNTNWDFVDPPIVVLAEETAVSRSLLRLRMRRTGRLYG